MYSSAFNVVEQCEAWAGSAGTEGQAMQSFQAVKGELLELARSQVSHRPFFKSSPLAHALLA